MNFELNPTTERQMPNVFGSVQYPNQPQQNFGNMPNQYGNYPPQSFFQEQPQNRKGILALVLGLIGLGLGFAAGYLYRDFKAKVIKPVADKIPWPQKEPKLEKSVLEQHQEFKANGFMRRNDEPNLDAELN